MSLLRKSGRQLRLNLFFLFILMGGGAMFLVNDLLIQLLGIIVTIASLVFSWFGINCPKCNYKWLLHFMRTSSSTAWLNDLYRMNKCPKCNYNAKTK